MQQKNPLRIYKKFEQHLKGRQSSFLLTVQSWSRAYEESYYYFQGKQQCSKNSENIESMNHSATHYACRVLLELCYVCKIEKRKAWMFWPHFESAESSDQAHGSIGGLLRQNFRQQTMYNFWEGRIYGIFFIHSGKLKHDIKNVRIWSYFGQYFPEFGLNTGIFSQKRENTDQKKSTYKHFLHSEKDSDFYKGSTRKHLLIRS